MSKKRKPDQKPEETETLEEKVLKMSVKLFEMQHPVLSPEGVMEESITRSVAEKHVPRTIRQTIPLQSTVSINAIPEDPDEDYEAYMEQQKTLNEISNKYRTENKLTQGDQVRSILQSIVNERKTEPEQDLTGKFIDFAIVERGTAYICIQRSINPNLKQPLPDPVKRSVSAIGNRLYSFAHENAPFFLNPDGTIDSLQMLTLFNADERRKDKNNLNIKHPAIIDHVMSNTLAEQMIFSGEILPNGKEHTVDVYPRSKAKNRTLISVKLAYDELKDKDGGKGLETTIKRLGLLERSTLDAITSAILQTPDWQPNTVFTVKNIAKEVFKCNDPTEKQIKQIKDVIPKLLMMTLKLDYSQHYKSKHPGGIDKCQFMESLLQASFVDAIQEDGTDVSCLTVSRMPVLSRYGDAVNQMIRTPSSILRVKDTDKAQARTPQALKINGEYWIRFESTPSMSGYRPLLVDYILRRIYAMYGDRKTVSETIKTDTIYAEIGNDLSRAETKRCRDFVELVLRSFCFDGIIKDFEIERKSGNTVTGYILKLSRQNPFKKPDAAISEDPEDVNLLTN